MARTIRLIDDHEVLYRSGTERVLTPARRFSGNPVLRQDRPWEAAIAWNAVHRDPATGKWQLWYQAYAGGRAKERSRRCVVCYTESDDGLRWTKPDLGLFDFNGDRNTNIVLVANGGRSDRYGVSVVVDPREANPARRYKMAYTDFAVDGGVERPGLCVAFSPDGVRWIKHPKAPLHRTSYGDYEAPVPFVGEAGRSGWDLPLTMADAVDIFWDPVRKVYADYAKMWIDGPAGGMYFKHAMGRIESRDFVHWSDAALVLTPDDLDAPSVEFHTSPVFYYGGRYLCLNQILNRAVDGGVIDVELMVSRDGLAWERPFRKAFFLPRGGAGQFDSGSVFTNATPVILGDEVRLYYGGYASGATGGDDEHMHSGIGLATVARDRFAGIRPVALSAQPTLSRPLERIGQATLKPQPLRGAPKLSVNADASQGAIRVELMDTRGRRLRGYSAADCLPITGDSLAHPVRWKGAPPLLADRYLVRIHMSAATLYAITIS